MLTSIVVDAEQSNLLADRALLCIFPPPYKISPRYSCSLQCLEAYPNNPTSLFAGQSFGKVHLLSTEDVKDSDNWIKYCFDLSGEELVTMRVCWSDTHVDLWCSSTPEYADALSRLPLSECPTTVPMLPETIALLEQLASVPLTATQIRT